MTEEHQSDQARFIADDEVLTFVDDEVDSPEVIDLDDGTMIARDWVHDPTEQAPNRWTNTETGEYRYQEEKPEPIDGDEDGDVIQVEVTDYDVDSEFGAKVGRILQEGSDPVGQIYAKAWQSFTGRIDDEELLFDALEQIADHGTQTAEDRIRQRLRGMGYDADEINKEISEGETGPEMVEPEWEDLEAGDTYEFEFPEAPGTQTATISEAPSGGIAVVTVEDGTQQEIARQTFENAVVPEPEYEDGEDFNFDQAMTEMDVGGTISADPGEIEDVSRLSQNASTEQLEEYAESDGAPGDPLEALQQWWDEKGRDHGGAALNPEVEASELVEMYENGEISEEEAWNEADRLVSSSGEKLGITDEDGARVARALLWYRDDTDMDPDISDLTTFDLANSENRHVEAQERTEEGIGEAMAEMDPAEGAWAISTLGQVKIEEIEGSAAGQHSNLGTITMDPTARNIEMTAAHEFGHQVHKVKGLSSENYPSSSEFDFGADRDEYGFGTPRRVIDEEAQELYDDMRKALEKNWDRYEDGDVREIRPYQKRHGVEYAAVTFAHWARDKAKLQSSDPFAKTMWDVHAGGGGYEPVDTATDMEEGDQIIIEGAFGPRLVEFAEANPDGTEFMAYPMGVDGKQDETALYPFNERLEDRVVRFND